MTTTTLPMPARASGPIQLYERLLGLADSIPLSLAQLGARVAVAHVFWNSAQTKLASWPSTIQLFKMEYRVPLLSPEIAAWLATATELASAVLLFLGLFTRSGALALFGLVAVIQLFVFPGNWGEHLLWASVLVLLIARGGGTLSLDALARRFLGIRNAELP